MKTSSNTNIRAEVLVSLIRDREKPYIVRHKSSFERNYENDLSGCKITPAYEEYYVSRDSLYHLLPEGLFHKIDRFNGIAQADQADKFKANLDIQEKEKQKALAFFAPFDNEIFYLEVEYQDMKARQTLFSIFSQINIHNIFKSSNPYIKKAFDYLPFVSNIRGDKHKIKIVLEKILGNHLNFKNITYIKKYYVEKGSSINKNILDGSYEINSMYCENSYTDTCVLFLVEIQKPVMDLPVIKKLEKELKSFCSFFQDFFLPVEEDMDIIVGDFNKSPVLKEDKPLFLGYNTQLL